MYFSCKAFPYPISHGKSKDGIQPFKGLKPAARTANSPENRAYRAACRGWHIPLTSSALSVQTKQGIATSYSRCGWARAAGCLLQKVGGKGRTVMNYSLRKRGKEVVSDFSRVGARGTGICMLTACLTVV